MHSQWWEGSGTSKIRQPVPSNYDFKTTTKANGVSLEIFANIHVIILRTTKKVPRTKKRKRKKAQRETNRAVLDMIV